MRTVRASVIVTTYNNPRYLEMVLAGYARQTCMDFEVVVADDGSGEPTRRLIDQVRAAGYPVPLVHAWQPDEGFRQSRSMSWGVLHSQGDQLLFTDGDCVPPANMVAAHLEVAAPNTLVVGGHIRLTEAATDGLDVNAIREGAHEALITAADRRRMWRWHLKNLFYIATGAKRRPKIYGLNMSVDRAGLLDVNGLDLNYDNNARQDSDLRNRMRLSGSRARCIWHRAIGVHLWHPEHKGRNEWSGADAYYHRKDLQPWAEHGLRELAAESGRSLPARNDG